MIGFTDRQNFHAKNFPALFRALQLDRVRAIYYDNEDAELKRAGGDYGPHQEVLRDASREVERLPLHRLYELEWEGVQLWDACRYELLQHLMLDRRFYDVVQPNDSEAIFETIARHHPQMLRLNIAAARYWVEYWYNQLAPHRAQRPTIAMFGNSLSYTRALALQADQLWSTPLVLEHFFTGQDHYMEPRLSPIQGFSEARIYADVEPDPELVYRRLRDMRNKNVTQASFRRRQRAGRGRKRVLVLGQVVNDFAAITPGNHVLGTVARYKQLTDALLSETDVDLIFKTHPYESHKTQGRGRVTYDELHAHTAARSVDRGRFRLVDDEPLAALLADADVVVTLHSQGGLEAIAQDVPVATLGNPFYGSQGFTHDFDEVSELVSAIQEETVFSLTEEHVDRYMRFMTATFRRLVNRHEPREVMLERLARVGVFPERVISRPSSSANGGRVSRIARKTRKLIRDPRRFFVDALGNLQKKL